MSKGFTAIGLLLLSNIFMTLAWYGHLHFKKYNFFQNSSILGIILISWGLALFEYVFQVPANKIGYDGNNGPFTLFQLKIIQEAISLIVFAIMAVFIFKTDKFTWNQFIGFIFLLIAVYFVFKK